MTTPSALTAEEVIRLLGLAPHPEGGHFRRMFEDIDPDGGRARSTAIYYLLAMDEVSAWHRVDAAEVWHWYAGAPLSLSLSPDGRSLSSIRLGANLAAGERPQAVVPTGCWQSAECLGAWTLVGCTVAPGFRFDGFEMAPPGWHPGRERSR